MKLALKPTGVFVVCLPVKLRDASRSGPNNSEMRYRTIDEYEALFKVAGFVSFFTNEGPRVYTPGVIGMTTNYGQEAVWILKPNKTK